MLQSHKSGCGSSANLPSRMAALRFFVSLLLLVLSSYGGEGTDVEWFISPNGSADIATCGRSASEPCSSLQLILDQSPLFPGNQTALCYLSTGAADARDSTTLHFMGGRNFVPPVCLMNWVNLKVEGLNGTTITSGRFGAVRGIFEFINCTNVTIEGLHFEISAIARATLFFEACRDVSIAKSSFPVTTQSSIGVQILQCAGDILLSENRFYGDPAQASEMRRLNPLALDITHGCSKCTMPFSDNPYDFTDRRFSLEITDCIIEDVLDGSPPVDSYKAAHTSSVGMRLRFGDGSTGNRAAVTSSTFRRITNSRANGVLVTLSGDASSNEVVFEGCSFYQNRVRYGGGMAAYFYSGPSNNTLRVLDSYFFNNTADFEGGGFFAALLTSGADNEIVVSNSTFSHNSALFGSAVFLLNNPSWFWNRGAFNPAPFPLVGAELRDCRFEGNKARLTEGIVNALRIELNISGVR